MVHRFESVCLIQYVDHFVLGLKGGHLVRFVNFLYGSSDQPLNVLCICLSLWIVQALRAVFDPRVLASFCYFATDVHSSTLGAGSNDDTLERIRQKTIQGEVGMVFGKQVRNPNKKHSFFFFSVDL